MAIVDFTRIDKLLDALIDANSDKMWFFAINKDVQNEIIRMNTEDQLEKDGIDSLGRSLGSYSPLTIMYKKMKGQRYDHVTLKDTGEFYNSWRVTVTVNEVGFDADDQKDDTALFEVYGVDVLGLTDENMQYLKEMIVENYIKFLLNEIL